MCKSTELVDRLSAAERDSLMLMGARSQPCSIPGMPIPFGHAEKLIELGLAELITGEPGLTSGGRRVLALIAA